MLDSRTLVPLFALALAGQTWGASTNDEREPSSAEHATQDQPGGLTVRVGSEAGIELGPADGDGYTRFGSVGTIYEWTSQLSRVGTEGDSSFALDYGALVDVMLASGRSRQRTSLEMSLGAGSAGWDGTLLADLGFGGCLSGSALCPVVRGGLTLELDGNDGQYRSQVTLPTMDAGLQLWSGGVLAELSGTLGFTLVGLHRVERERASTAFELSRGARLFLGWQTETDEHSRISMHARLQRFPSNSEPVTLGSVSLCTNFGALPIIAGICTTLDHHRIPGPREDAQMNTVLFTAVGPMGVP